MKSCLLTIFLLLLSALANASAPSCSSLLLSDNKRLSPEVLNQLFNSYTPFDFNEFPSTNGIELEGVVSDWVKSKDLMRMIYGVVRENEEDLNITHNAANTTYFKGAHQYEYVVKSESFLPPAGKWAVELNSPVLRDESDVELFYQVVDKLKEEGVRPYEESAGVHLHVGFPLAKIEEVVVLLYVMSIIEQDIYKIFAVSKKREELFAAKLGDHFDFIKRVRELKDINEISKLLSGPEAIKASGGVFQFGLNIASLLEHGTAEFRLFNSSFDKEQIEIMRDFVTKLVVAVRSKNKGLEDILLNHSRTGEFDIEEFIAALDLKLLKNENRFLNSYQRASYGRRLRTALNPGRLFRFSSNTFLIGLIFHLF